MSALTKIKLKEEAKTKKKANKKGDELTETLQTMLMMEITKRLSGETPTNT